MKSLIATAALLAAIAGPPYAAVPDYTALADRAEAAGQPGSAQVWRNLAAFDRGLAEDTARRQMALLREIERAEKSLAGLHDPKGTQDLAHRIQTARDLAEAGQVIAARAAFDAAVPLLRQLEQDEIGRRVSPG